MKDNYSAVSESIATFSDRVAIMDHADAVSVYSGAFEAVVHLGDKHARLSLTKLDAAERQAPAFRERARVCDFQWEAGGWQLTHVTLNSSQE